MIQAGRQAVQDSSMPTNVSSVKQFLGVASYYRHCISIFSTIVAPLTNLTLRSSFSWSVECESPFYGSY